MISFWARIVLGTLGRGKSFHVVNNYKDQQISKILALYCYDFKYPDLSIIAYNKTLQYTNRYSVDPLFYIINIDKSERSHCCNPIDSEFMTDISDTYGSAYKLC